MYQDKAMDVGARKLVRAYLAVLLTIVGAVFPWHGAWADERLYFDGQVAHPAATSGSLVTIEGPWIGGHLVPRAQLSFVYQRDALVYKLRGQRIGALDHRVGAELNISMGLANRIEVALSLPVVIHQEGFADTQAIPDVDQRGVGDVSLAAKVRLMGTHVRGFSLALLTEARLPSAGKRSLSGSGFALEPQILAAYRRAWFHLHGSVGYRYQAERRLFSLEVDDQLLVGVGTRVEMSPTISLLLEIIGQTAAERPFRTSQTTPVVALAGVQTNFGPFSLRVAAGPGITSAYASPQLEAYALLSFSPGGIDSDSDGVRDKDDRCPLAAEDRDGYRDLDGCPDSDNDGDGIVDNRDRCPNKAEDRDAFKDSDGCPDPDNDHDRIMDSADKCPNDAEDRDGFEDYDGCPDRDNDKDGIPDSSDKCPLHAEVFNEIDDEDGCPEADQDADGILDQADQCPKEAEDKNGIEDDDGCPDDPDKDRIPKRLDRCPIEAETYNGYRDKDGCPDDPTPKVSVREHSVWTSEAVYFDTDSWHIDRRFRRLLRKVARALSAEKRLKMLYVEGHADPRGDENYNQWISFKRAKSVVRYLARHGVSRRRMRALGWGVQRPWQPNTTRRGRARNRRVLFHIVRRGRKQKRRPVRP